MNKIYLILFLIIIIRFDVNSQSCLPNGIRFTKQEQIDNFEINYPNCTKIEGHVTIGGINNTYIINNLNGLNNINTIGEYLSISYNDSLINLSGLEGLDSVEAVLAINNNKLLKNIDGLENLIHIGGYLRVEYNDSLESLTGLVNLDTNSITDLIITENKNLSSCNAQVLCDYLLNPHGVVEIYDNANGCNNPPEIAENCGISLPCLPYGNYYLYTQQEIDSFQFNYTNCSDIKGDVYIEGDSIVNLLGLNNWTSVEGDMRILSTSLVNLNGLDNLVFVGRNLSIGANDLLLTLIGIGQLDSIGLSISISWNDNLLNLDGIESLRTIYSTFSIFSNHKLNSIEGLSGLDSVGQRLFIFSNSDLPKLDGLEGVNKIGNELDIHSNSSLIDISGIENIDLNSIYRLSIYANQLLSECEVESVCKYLSETISGYEIHDNIEGCMNRDEVIEACLQGIPKENILYNNLFYPNPAKKELFFNVTDIYSIKQITIFNQLGENIFFTNDVNQPINISKLEQGLYIVELVLNELRVREKLIVLE